MLQDASAQGRNFKLLLEYDGTDFVGWQIQEHGRSVQGELQKVLTQLLQENVDVIGAGRTDSGVHARGQVANVRTRSNRRPEELHRALNGLLPEDIRIRAVEEVDWGFHARYSAKERRYGYYISRENGVFDRRYAWFLGYALDSCGMNDAAEIIKGVHDFMAFSKTDSGVEGYVCNVLDARWLEESDHLVFDIRADRFVRGMVRALVGTMVDVGRRVRTLEDFKRMLLNGDRTSVSPFAPAKGLFLEEVIY